VNDTRMSFVKDPHLPWDGPFPYEYLAARLNALGCAPIDAGSSADIIKDVLFDLMAGNPDREEARMLRAAWDELRQPQRRLLVDFFMYEIPELDLERVVADLRALDLPVVLPNFTQLADVAAHPEVLVPTVALGGPPAAAEAPPASLPTIDIGQARADLLVFLEDAHD
jgi:hypothetical protein